MNLTELSLKQWPAICVIMALIVLFGILSMLRLPIEMLPKIERPQISISTFWRAAAPEELESNMVEPIEDVVRNIPGLQDMNSRISRGGGWINLTFELGTDIDRAKLDVINRMSQVQNLPRDANEPNVSSGGRGGATPNLASLLIRTLPGNPEKNVAAYQTLIDQTVEPRLARIPGVSSVNLAGQLDRQLIVNFDAYRAAALGISIQDINNVIGRASDLSGGFADVGRRQYTVRFIGQFDLDNFRQMIVGWNNERPVYLHEIAEIEIDFAERRGFSLRNGYPAYYITLEREYESNSVEILDGVNNAIKELNDGPLKQAGLAIDLSFDSSIHIRRAISLVRGNLGIGLLLALSILYFFMRSRRAIALIAVTVPLSLLVAFIALSMFNKTLNVISLAGLAFAVGLVMDAAIITLENITRLKQKGKDTESAIRTGTHQISGALFASTTTSIAIFLPVFFMRGIEGQLFRDLALTLAVAVCASFFIAVTILPVVARKFLTGTDKKDPCESWWENISVLVHKLTGKKVLRLFWIGGILITSVLVITTMLPKANLLPNAKSDSLNAFFQLPPGTTVDILEGEFGQTIANRLKPYMEHKKEPYIRGYNLSAFNTFNGMFLYPSDANRIDEMIEIVQTETLRDMPDVTAFVSQSSLINFDFDGGRSINVDFQGPDIEQLAAAASTAQPILRKLLPEARIRPIPGLQIAEPEIQLKPDDRRLTAAGMDRNTVAQSIRTLTSGTFIGETFDGNERMDIILRGPIWNSPEQLAATPIATPLAGIQTIGELTTIERTVGPTQLFRYDGQRTITLSVTPPDHMSVEEALEIIRDQAGPEIKAAINKNVKINYRGTADQLEKALAEMGKNIMLAIVILFFIMAAMFRSIRDSLLVLLAMPMALAGGILSLQLLNVFSNQPLDLLTMIGFVILLGLVVNNAILLVLQTRTGEAEGLDRETAVKEAVRIRARPIYMSTLTSIFGMLPLMLTPGLGSEIYRGLAAVIIGGMTLSALLTLILLPALLKLQLPTLTNLNLAKSTHET